MHEAAERLDDAPSTAFGGHHRFQTRPHEAIRRTDSSGTLAAVAKQLGIDHHALNASADVRVQGPWHIQNGNVHHGRVNERLRRFHSQFTPG